MRITVRPVGQQSIVLVDGSDLNAWAINGDMCVLSPEPEGLEGWRESAPVKFDDPGEMPLQDGAFWPEQTFLERRVLTIRGIHMAEWLPGSSELAAARFRDQLAALTGVAVEVQVHDQAGPRTVQGYFSAPPGVYALDDLNTEFTLFVTCPDPLKYGSAIQYSAGGGVLTVENAGTGEVPFVAATTDQVTNLSISMGGARVEWQGNSAGLLLDLADGVPRDNAGNEVGVLVWADLLRVPPGQHELQVESDAVVTLTVRPGWK